MASTICLPAGKETDSKHEILVKAVLNPILTTRDWPHPIGAIYNPGAVWVEGRGAVLIPRVEDRRGISHLGLAVSENGFTDWKISPFPFASPEASWEEWGLEDPRIVWLEDLDGFAITYTAYSSSGPKIALAFTKDFETCDKAGVISGPEDKDAALFPEKIGRYYYMIHRPIVSGEANMWISRSDDLLNWKDSTMLMSRLPGYWDSDKIGLGPPPVKTEKGWLIFYHGVKMAGAGPVYRVGAALLDLESPWKVIARSSSWLLSPDQGYEYAGQVPNVVFPTGIIVSGDIFVLYYGAADTCIAAAVGKVTEVLEFLENEG